jgi:hypothetical protein
MIGSMGFLNLLFFFIPLVVVVVVVVVDVVVLAVTTMVFSTFISTCFGGLTYTFYCQQNCAVVIKNADMSDTMQQDAVDIASIALSKYNIEKVSS